MVNRLISPAEAARMLGVSTRSLLELTRAGVGPDSYAVTPRTRRYSEESVEEFIVSSDLPLSQHLDKFEPVVSPKEKP